MARRKFDVSTVKTLSTFGLGKSKADRAVEDEKLRQEEIARDMMNRPQRIPSSDLGRGFSMEDGIEPWEIAGDAPVFLICPQCSGDVEEVTEPAFAWKPEGELVAGKVPEFKSAFCYCPNPKCNGIRYFMVELMRMKSWRRGI